MADKAPSVDKEEYDFFTQASKDWWNGPMDTLRHLVNTVLEQILNILKDSPNNIRILDVGSGGGFMAEPLAKSGFMVTGIDVNESLVNVAKEHAAKDSSLTNLTYYWESIEDHALENAEKYDVVILNSVLQHALKHDVVLENSVKVLKPGGLIFISAASKTFKSWFRVIFFGQVLTRTFKQGTYHWRNFIDYSDVERILSDNGCVVQETTGIFYDLFSLSWKFTPSKDVFYFMYGIKK